MNNPTISIVIPGLNEQRNIALIYDKLSQALLGESYEIIFVDDGSQDRTPEEIATLAGKDQRVRGLSLSRNFGHQAALKAGLDFANGEAVISMDCDLEHPTEIIPQMLKLWREGSDVVITKRENSLKLPFLKQWTSRLFYWFLNQISEVPIEPGSADFRLMDRKVVMACRSLTENDLFWRGIIAWLGFRTSTLRYHQASRLHGQSKYNFKRMIRLSLAGITGFSVRPLYLGLYLGAFFATTSFCYLAYAVGVKLFGGESVLGWASVLASVLLIGGVQLLILGIMGIYLGRLFMQSKARPHYVIRATYQQNSSDSELKRVI